MDVSKEQLRDAFNRAPFPIREFLVDGKLGPAVEKLALDYRLHVDISGKLIDLLRKTLLGFLSPSDFPEKLTRDIGLSQEQLAPFIQDLNTGIFMPLQKAVREYGPEPSYEERVALDDPEPSPPPSAETVAPPAPLPTLQPTPSPGVPVMQIGPQDQAVPQTYAPPVHMPIVAVPVRTPDAPHVPVAPTSQPTPYPHPASYPTSTPPPLYSQAPVYEPHARTMAEDMQLASHGLQGQAVTPARSFQTASVPITYATPPATASALPSPQAPSSSPTPSSPPVPSAPNYRPPVMAPVRLTPVDHAHHGVPLTKEYGNDPYREPIQ